MSGACRRFHADVIDASFFGTHLTQAKPRSTCGIQWLVCDEDSDRDEKNTRQMKETIVFKPIAIFSAVVLALAASGANVHAQRHGLTLVVTMTNDLAPNEIKVYEAATKTLLQTLPTDGTGGVGGNARGVNQYKGALFAAVNNGSNTVAVFRRAGDSLRFEKLVATTSPPVSIDFGNNHMYVAGATTVDSFVIHGLDVGWMDGTTDLVLAGGGAPPNGSAAQVGIISQEQLLVTLKADPDPGTVDVVTLHDGAITGAVPTAVSAPASTLTPFGFSVYSDGTAVITLAHSDQYGLFRDGQFISVTAAGQAAPCWSTRVGKYVFTGNTGSHTISRLVGTGNNIFVDGVVAGNITGGAPSDVDADDGFLGVIDHGAGQSHLSLFTYNQFGELTASGAPINLGVENANGVAIMSSADFDQE
jgi:hypothetical protein